MKTLYKTILAVLGATLLLCGCNKKEYAISDKIILSRCLQPVQNSAKVLYTNVTFTWDVFPDAEKYEIEIYSAVPAEGKEPDPAKLLKSDVILPTALPYVYNGPDETKCFYRVRATAPTSTRGKSLWTTGSFITETDPSTVCSKPSDAKANAMCDRVTWTWTTYPDTEIYELDVYTKPIPEEGEPDTLDLYESKKINVTDVPFVEKYPAGATYYFRVRATNPTTGLKSSKWVKGSFKTKAFNWPVSAEAIDTAFVDTWTDGQKTGFNYSQTVDTAPVTNHKITYCPKMKFYGNRIQYYTPSGTVQTTQYGEAIPKDVYCIKFKICRPGTLKLLVYTTAGANCTVAILTNRDGEGLKSKWVLNKTGLPTTMPSDLSVATNPDAIPAEITEDDLYGITEPATVYIFAQNLKSMFCAPIGWTPKENNNN